MRIALAQQNYRIGDINGNTEKILLAIQTARQSEADLILFSELAICGYPPRDLLEFREFIESCEHALERIRNASTGIGVVVGAP